MIVRWQEKDWLRVGECNRCGECCAFGWKNPCPHHTINPDFTSSCKIYDQRANGDDEEALRVAGVLTTACEKFPQSPGDLLSPYIRNRCSYQFIECEKILIACPTYGGKAYAWDRWLAAIRALTYPNYEVLVVDNSRDRTIPDVDGLRVIHTGRAPGEEGLGTVCRSMEVIRSEFLAGSCSRWLNIEADVIVPPDTVETMLAWGKGADWIAHAYPSRGNDQWGDLDVESLCGIGCSLLSRAMIERLGWEGAGADSPDCYLWSAVRRAKCFQTIELWGVLKLGHLGN